MYEKKEEESESYSKFKQIIKSNFSFKQIIVKAKMLEEEEKLTANPTAPRPKTATDEPECTLAVFQAAPTPTFSFHN